MKVEQYNKSTRKEKITYHRNIIKNLRKKINNSTFSNDVIIESVKIELNYMRRLFAKNRIE